MVDKNNIEICEGHIVKVLYHNGFQRELVVFRNNEKPDIELVLCSRISGEYLHSFDEFESEHLEVVNGME